MSPRPDPDVPSSPLGRRGFLSLAGALGGVAAWGGVGGSGTAWAAAPGAGVTGPAASPAGAAGGANAPLSFAVLTDTHANVDAPAGLDTLRRTFASVEAANPTFVLNCGDITDYGADDEFEAYLSTIPAGLRDRLHHVPGNHEVRWDVHGRELYHRLFGPAPYSFDVAGLHVVGLDPTQLLQEPGHFGRDGLRWLADDLSAARPSVLFLHYPMGGEHYYVNDQDAFFETVADLPVRAIFAGHIHREQVVRTNGLTQVAANAVKNGAFYYWVDRVAEAGHSVLRVAAVAVAADGTETRRDLTTIPLEEDRTTRQLRPVRIDVGAPSGGRVRVDVRVPSTGSTGTQAQVYPQQIFGGGSAGTWADLTRTSRGWSGSVDVAALAAGTHRLQVRVLGAGGARYDATRPFTVAADGTAPHDRWQARLPGSIQGALAAHDGLVVAATTSGVVEVFRPTRAGREVAWRATLGPVHRGPAFTADGATVLVPSADHHLYALDAADGSVRWRFGVPDPVLSSPLVTSVDEVATVVFSAGTTLYAVHAETGERRWKADLHGFFAGRAACDGDRVYVGGGDGRAYAFDAATGAQAWSYDATTRQDSYGRLLYGPWDDTIELLPGGGVLVSTVSSAAALDGASGQRRWSVPGSYIYSPSPVTERGVVLIDEWGRVQLVDPATGAATWKAEIGARALNSGPVVVGDLMWNVAVTGLLACVDLTDGTVRHRRQLGPANTFSTPVLVDGLLVTGDQDGTLRGIELP
ncbi:PQQ-binding-like beta-propeller repeat protein [Actinopolymorpha rutila]|uniref:Outer membrane protein assembly factor BamB n=1 Tax=Actinopolymorpha rutila TaxID=446787 RepID=A0A852ZLW4_9ACTN|nr:PQQ-binding-like beta-propeller repeat protein [Actinopolymorpha rutila]NYH89416.1 outer membrane protein assembly factor BamB [Actinopolymorpha rutila]